MKQVSVKTNSGVFGFGRTGVTVIEIMISLLIFGFCLIPIFDLLNKSLQITKITQEEVAASTLANELLDQICSIPFRDLPPLNELPIKKSEGIQLIKGQAASTLILSDLPSGFDRYLSIESVSSRMKKAKVKIVWGSSPPHALSFQAIVEWTP